MALSGIKHIDVGAELSKTEWEDEANHELVSGSAFPTIPAPVDKQLFYRTDLHEWYIYNGTGWLALATSTVANLNLALHVSRHGYLGADEFSLIRPISQRAIPFLYKNWAEISGFTTSLGTGCGFTVGFPYGTLYTSTTNNQEAIIYSTAGFYQAYAYYGYSWGMRVSIRQGGTQVIGVGMFATPSGIDLLPATHQDHIGFIVDTSGNLLCSSGSTVDETQTDTGVDITGQLDMFLSIYANNVGIYFYVDHVLKATHLLASSYYPNAANCYATTYIKNTDSLAKSIFITPLSLFAQFVY